MSKGAHKLFSSRWGWLAIVLVLVAINYVASVVHTRADLTKEKRYTLSNATRRMVRTLDSDVQIDVFLKGEFPSGFRKLANSTQEFLQLLKDLNGSRIRYRFISPQEQMPGTEVSYGDSLVNMGAVPINLTVQKEAGQSSNIIFPVALIRYRDRQSLVNLYPGASGRISQEEINSAEALMEYQFINALDKIKREKKPTVGYAIGNGEPMDARTYDMVQTLSKDYEFFTFDLAAQPVVPDDLDVLLIVKPAIQFSEKEKLKIDQYVMRGGKLLCFIDNLIAEQDSLSFKPETIAYDRNLNLTDLFFRYGLRINTDLVMDLQCDMLPFVVGGNVDKPQYEFLRWNYFPLFAPGSAKLLNKNLGYIASRFVNSIDTIKSSDVKKTILLASSANSRTISTPALISLNENKNAPEDAKFKKADIPVTVLLEGAFTSLYSNRASRAEQDSLRALGTPFQGRSVKETKIIVAADGDMVLNDIIPQTGPLPMGWNKYTYSEYQKQTEEGKLFIPVANREFLLNCMEYMVNNAAISETRNKDIVLRLLDSQKVKNGRLNWQLINIAVPILLVVLAGFIYQYIRKRQYAE